MSGKKEPTGKERMLRSPPSDPSLRPERFEFDLEKAYTQEQLAKIGVIALMWNRIEQRFEHLMMVAFQRSFPSLGVWCEIQNAIKRMDDHISVLKKFADESSILTDKAKACIKSAFDTAKEYRKYRNAVVHSYIFDHKQGIAVHVDQRSKPLQVLLTIEALTTFYDNLLALDNELREIDPLFRMARGGDSAVVINPKTNEPEKDQPKALRERAVPTQTEVVIEHANKRVKLPKFPDAHLIMPKVGVMKITSSEKRK